MLGPRSADRDEPGSNKNTYKTFIDTEDDAVEVLRLMPTWGIRMWDGKGGTPSFLSEGLLIDGAPR